MCKGKGPMYMFQGLSRTSSFSMTFNPTTIVMLKEVWNKEYEFDCAFQDIWIVKFSQVELIFGLDGKMS